jgi:hypothetical protein
MKIIKSKIRSFIWRAFLYVYIFMYVCMYACVCVCVCVYVCMYVCMYSNTLAIICDEEQLMLVAIGKAIER